MDNFNIAAVVVSICSLVGYHAFLYGRAFCSRNPQVQITRTMRNSFHWVVKHLEKQDAPNVTLAIQTLRNTILVAIFIGGQSFVYGFTSLNSIDASSSIKDTTRAIIISTLLFLSFLSFANVIRYSSHVGYYIGNPNLPAPETTPMVGVMEISRDEETAGQIDVSVGRNSLDVKRDEGTFMMEMLLISFSLGFRFIFAAIPFVFYVAGPIALVVSTGVVLLFLYSIEPRHENEKMSVIRV